jgi:hypothetical protein
MGMDIGSNDIDAEGRNSDAEKACKSGVWESGGGGARVPTDTVAKACDGWLMYWAFQPQSPWQQYPAIIVR